MFRFAKKEYLYAAVAIFLWSTIATVAKLLLDGSLNSMQVLAVSSLFAFLFQFAVCLAKGELRALRRYTAKDYLILAGIGLLGTFAYNLFLYLGIDKMQASQAFIVNYLWPIMIVVFACLILREKMTARKLAAIGLSFLGVVIVTAGGDLLHIERDTLLGALYCAIAAISYGLFSVLNKRNRYDKYLSMMLFYLFSFLLSFGYIALTGAWFTPTGAQIAGFAWTGICTYAIPYTAWALALDAGDTAKIANLAYITPFLSLIWTFFILKEPLSLYSIAGLLVIVLGIFIQLRDKAPARKA